MPDNDTGRFRVTLPSESTELPKTNSTMEPPQGMIPGIRQLGGTEETVRETIVRSMREVEQKSAAAPNIGGHEPLPRSWIEAVPAILFGFYGLACAFEAVAAMNRGDFFIFSLNSGACALLAGISLAWWKRRDWLPQKLVSTATLIVTDARWILASISVLLIVSALRRLWSSDAGLMCQKKLRVRLSRGHGRRYQKTAGHPRDQFLGKSHFS
jgi:hypothetical protein